MATNVELFYFPASFYSQKARMYLCEKGITPKLHTVSIQNDGNLDPEFLRMNPAGKVPVMRVGQTVVPDSHDIYKYGEENMSGPTLTPPHIAEKVWKLHEEIHAVDVGVISFGCVLQPELSSNVQIPSMFQKMARRRMTLDNSTKSLEALLASGPKDLASAISAKIEDRRRFFTQVRDRNAVFAALDVADKLLGKCEAQVEQSPGPFLFGATLTIADIDLIVLLLRLTMLGLKERMFSPTGPRKNLTRFLEEMEKRESCQLIKKDVRGAFVKNLSIFPIVSGALVVVGLAVGIGLLIKSRRFPK